MKRDTLSIISGALVAGIAIIAFILSYEAIRALAVASDVPDGLSYLVPLIIDGAMVVLSVSVMRATLAGEDTRTGWALIVAFMAVSVWFNIAHSNMSVTGIAIAALAPVALFTTFETLMSQIRSTVQGGINALATHWQRRAKLVIKIAKCWRQRAGELTAALNDAKSQIDGLLARVDNLQAKANEAQGLKAENGRLQKEVDRLTKEAERMQTVYDAWQHMNEKAQAAAMYNAGQFGTLEDAATMAKVSPSTVSRIAGQLNGVTK